MPCPSVGPRLLWDGPRLFWVGPKLFGLEQNVLKMGLRTKFIVAR